MSKRDKEKINPWEIIDTYFRDTSYYKSQHQIDSFDEFIFSKENGIDKIIRRENPYILFKGDNQGKGTFSHEIQIFFGETLHQETGEILSDKENIFISSPTIFYENQSKYMYPNDARLKNLT